MNTINFIKKHNYTITLLNGIEYTFRWDAKSGDYDSLCIDGKTIMVSRIRDIIDHGKNDTCKKNDSNLRGVKILGYMFLGIAILFLILRYCLPYGQLYHFFGVVSEDITFADLSPFSMVAIVFHVILMVGIIGIITLSFHKVVTNIAIIVSLIFYIVEFIVVHTALLETPGEAYWYGSFYVLIGGGLIGSSIFILKDFNEIDNKSNLR